MYLTFDQMFDVRAIFADVAKRLYIMAGTAGLLMLIPLAVTSTAAMVRRMGPKNWQRLHRLIYFATLAGVIHYYWLVKSDVREPLMYVRHSRRADGVSRVDMDPQKARAGRAATGRQVRG